MWRNTNSKFFLINNMCMNAHVCPYMSLKVEKERDRARTRQGSEINKEEMTGKGECLWWENERAGERE